MVWFARSRGVLQRKPSSWVLGVPLYSGPVLAYPLLPLWQGKRRQPQSHNQLLYIGTQSPSPRANRFDAISDKPVIDIILSTLR